jgi:hypothetical protein
VEPKELDDEIFKEEKDDVPLKEIKGCNGQIADKQNGAANENLKARKSRAQEYHELYKSSRKRYD